MSIRLDLENVYTRVSGTDEAADHVLDAAFSYHVDGYRFMAPFKAGKWDGKKHLYRYNKIPSGLITEAIDILEQNGYNVKVVDHRVKPDHPLKSWNLRGAEQRDHQMEAIVAAIEEERGVVWHATGGGKTEVMAGITQMLDLPTLILMHKSGLAHQTQERLAQRLGKRVGVITGEKKIDGDIVCATFQSLQAQLESDKENQTKHLLKWISKFKVLHIDEGHHALANTYNQVINMCPAYYRFGYSATYEKTNDKGARLSIIGATGPVLDRFTAGEGVKAGLLVKVNVTYIKWHEDTPKDYWKAPDFEINDKDYTWVGKKNEWVETRGGELVKQPLETPVLGLYDVGIVRNKPRNSAIIDAAATMHEDGLTTLILVSRVDHALYLKKQIERDIREPVLFLHGPDSKSTRDTAKKQFAQGKYRILIATSIFDEGEDVPAIDGLILAGGGKAQHTLIQRLGRGMRPKEGKTELRAVDFYDTNSRTLWKHSKERMKVYQSDKDAYTVEMVELEP